MTDHEVAGSAMALGLEAAAFLSYVGYTPHALLGLVFLGLGWLAGRYGRGFYTL